MKRGRERKGRECPSTFTESTSPRALLSADVDYQSLDRRKDLHAATILGWDLNRQVGGPCVGMELCGLHGVPRAESKRCPDEAPKGSKWNETMKSLIDLRMPFRRSSGYLLDIESIKRLK